MKIKFSQRYLQSLYFRIIASAFILVTVYQIFFWILDFFNLQNKYQANIFTVIITIFGFYFSIIPIKILSTIFPSWYSFTGTTKYPISNNFWVFLVEQFLIVIFLSITLFSIYILIMWAKRLLKKIMGNEPHVKWSKRSILLGILSFVYYLMILLIATFYINF